MMLGEYKLTDYYKMVGLREYCEMTGTECKALKTPKYVCVASTGSYEPFESRARQSDMKTFSFFLTEGKPATFNNAPNVKKADFTITYIKSISGVYIPVKSVRAGYGDTKGTCDALLFLWDECFKTIETFVARGLKLSRETLYELYINGQLDAQIGRLRSVARSVVGKEVRR